MSQENELFPEEQKSTESAEVKVYGKIKGEPFTKLPEDLYIPPDALELFLESFEGPFDLLLYLIRRQRLDLNEISVAAVTDQYMVYVEEIRSHNMELASDYLVMAAELMMIKSRLLLPRPEREDDEEEEEDPTARILREVAEYEKIQIAAQLLNALPKVGSEFWTGHVVMEKEDVPEPTVLPQELARVWLSVLKRSHLDDHHKISRQELSVIAYKSAILKKVTERSFVDFIELLREEKTRQGQVVSFLAILELAREGSIDISQAAPYAPIYITVV